MTASIAILPNELLLYVFMFLDQHSLQNAGRVCKNWQQVVLEPSVWRALFHLRFEDLVERNASNYASVGDWRATYAKEHLHEKNWGYPSHPSTRFQLSDHQSKVTKILFGKKNSNIVVASCENSNILFWDLNQTAQCIQTFQNTHNGAAKFIQFDGSESFLLSCGGAVDRELKLWDIEQGKTVWENIVAHRNGIYCARIEGNVIVTSSFKEIKVWDLKSGKTVHTFPSASKTMVDSLFVKNETIVSGDRDGKVKLWTMTGVPLLEFTAYSYQASHIQVQYATTRGEDVNYNGGYGNDTVAPSQPNPLLGDGIPGQQHIITSGGSGVKVWDMNGQRLRKVKANKEWFHAYRCSLTKNRLVSGWKKIYVWDVEKRIIIHELQGKQPTNQIIKALEFDIDNGLIGAAVRKNVYVWKFHRTFPNNNNNNNNSTHS